MKQSGLEIKHISVYISLTNFKKEIKIRFLLYNTVNSSTVFTFIELIKDQFHIQRRWKHSASVQTEK